MSNKKLEYLKDPNLLLIFTYAPAGLGHLRVTDALYDGLEKNIRALLLGAEDKSITILHRMTSVNIFARELFEWVQHDSPEEFFTPYYRAYLRSNAKTLYMQLKTLIHEYIKPPGKILIVSTHFSLAHQIAEIKKTIFKEEKIPIKLAVQVTDDSPQKIWYVDGADVIFVPSRQTEKELSLYGRRHDLKKLNFIVNPYPISPILTKKLTDESVRQKQFSKNSTSKIHLCIPVSGAAVGLEYFLKIMKDLNSYSERFIFYIVSKKAPFTKRFLQRVSKMKNVKVYSSNDDREVVSYYEEVYKNNSIALEITKPSEQAFKALYDPSLVGGSILLFSKPVGRQEYDNLDFLARHFLIPDELLQKKLWKMAEEQESVQNNEKLMQIISYFRGLKISENSETAAGFIMWCLNEGIFERMLEFKKFTSDEHKQELGIDGVEKFWEKVGEIV